MSTYSLGRPVNSISRAVTILGFDAVRDLATAIALFEEFIKSGVEKEGISKLLTTSFLSALQARDLAVEKRMQVAPEEAFICTLLHNLGKIIVCIHAPEFYNEIEELIENGMTEDAASLKVLNDADYRMVGEEVAKFWNLSEKAILSMSTMPKKPEGPYDTDTYLQNLANFTNTLVSSICNQSETSACLDPLIEKYGEMMSLDKQEAINMVYKCVEASEDISDSIRYGLSKLKIRSRIARLEREIKDPSLARKRTVYLFPICIGNKPIGLIYLDHKAGRPRLDRTNIKNVRLFRDFAVMAIRKMQGRK